MLSFWNKETFTVRYHFILIELFIKLGFFLDRQNYCSSLCYYFVPYLNNFCSCFLKPLIFLKKTMSNLSPTSLPVYYFPVISLGIKLHSIFSTALYSYFFTQTFWNQWLHDHIIFSKDSVTHLKKEWVLPPKVRGSLAGWRADKCRKFFYYREENWF